MTVERLVFGVDKQSKRAVHLFRWANTSRPDGLEVSVSSWGATVVSVRAPDRDGAVEEVTLNHRGLAGIQQQTAYYGAAPWMAGPAARNRAE